MLDLNDGLGTSGTSKAIVCISRMLAPEDSGTAGPRTTLWVVRVRTLSAESCACKGWLLFFPLKYRSPPSPPKANNLLQQRAILQKHPSLFNLKHWNKPKRISYKYYIYPINIKAHVFHRLWTEYTFISWKFMSPLSILSWLAGRISHVGLSDPVNFTKVQQFPQLYSGCAAGFPSRLLFWVSACPQLLCGFWLSPPLRNQHWASDVPDAQECLPDLTQGRHSPQPTSDWNGGKKSPCLHLACSRSTLESIHTPDLPRDEIKAALQLTAKPMLILCPHRPLLTALPQ